MINQPPTISPRPMGDINSAMRDLNIDADKVRALVDTGHLVGFNIAVNPKGKKDLRILTASIQRFAASPANAPDWLEWPELFRLILPLPKKELRGTEIARGLNCDRGHVENLIKAKLLLAVSESKPGPNGSPAICCKSYEHFLMTRLQ